eukprot:691127-Pyramimonas_sp.AAC.1
MRDLKKVPRQRGWTAATSTASTAASSSFAWRRDLRQSRRCTSRGRASATPWGPGRPGDHRPRRVARGPRGGLRGGCGPVGQRGP